MKNILQLKLQSFREEKILSYENNSYSFNDDYVAIEEPLEIKIKQSKIHEVPFSLNVTMRTPGNDFELIAGFLFSEGIIKSIEDIENIYYQKDIFGQDDTNTVIVEIKSTNEIDLSKFSRNIVTNSSCGMCSTVSIDQVYKKVQKIPKGDFQVDKDLILSLPKALNLDQNIFSKTGGVHASALFTNEGKLIAVMEDVGRHNAMDKLVGKMLFKKNIPLDNTMVLFSGRASFELVQKAVLAGIPFMMAIGAPSSLAIDLARSFNATLIGFLRNTKFNVYSGMHRIKDFEGLKI